MKKVTEFNKNNIKALRVEMDKAMQSISKKYGIEMQTGNASFSGNEVTFKVNANTVGSDGAAITKEAKPFFTRKRITWFRPSVCR
jgi:lipopolysaccharide export system protein LptA